MLARVAPTTTTELRPAIFPVQPLAFRPDHRLPPTFGDVGTVCQVVAHHLQRQTIGDLGQVVAKCRLDQRTYQEEEHGCYANLFLYRRTPKVHLSLGRKMPEGGGGVAGKVTHRNSCLCTPSSRSNVASSVLYQKNHALCPPLELYFRPDLLNVGRLIPDDLRNPSGHRDRFHGLFCPIICKEAGQNREPNLCF